MSISIILPLSGNGQIFVFQPAEVFASQGTDKHFTSYNFFLSSAEASKEKTPTTVVLGASFVTEWKISNVGILPIVMKGISGERSFEMLARFDRDVIHSKPQYVIIWGFINDIYTSDRKRIDQTLEKTKTSYRAMVSMARKNRIRPILGTELTVFGRKDFISKVKNLIDYTRNKELYRDYINKHVIEMNEWLKGYAREEKILILDFHRVLSGKDGIRKEEYTASDGAHISPEGYQKLNIYLNQTLKDFIR